MGGQSPWPSLPQHTTTLQEQGTKATRRGASGLLIFLHSNSLASKVLLKATTLTSHHFSPVSHHSYLVRTHDRVYTFELTSFSLLLRRQGFALTEVLPSLGCERPLVVSMWDCRGKNLTLHLVPVKPLSIQKEVRELLK